MKHETNMKRRLLGYLVTLTLVFTMLLGLGITASAADTILAFSSDVHNGTSKSGEPDNNVSGRRLSAWLDKIKAEYGVGNVDLMSFCGDMGPASGSATNFWDSAKYVMTTVSGSDAITSDNGKGLYTTGNHEYNPGDYGTSSTNNDTKKAYKMDKEGINGSNYRIYCLGSTSFNAGYTSDQISALSDYLNKTDNDKPIFIITHFPLHYYSSWRTTSNADQVIAKLNTAVDNGKTIVFLWGHNHTEADPHYDQVFLPGAGLKTTSSSSSIKGIKFYYAAAGAMADSEYGSSGQVKGKGLIVKVGDNKQLDFKYYNINGESIALTTNATGDGTPTDTPSGGDDPVVPVEGDVNIEPDTSNPEAYKTIAAGETFTINVTNGSSNSAYDFTLSLSKSGVAEIQGDATQNIAAGATKQFTVRGLTDGTVDINIKNSQSYSQYARKGVVHLTVGEGGSTPVDPEPQTGDKVDITPSTDNPERSIKIAVGDTLTINVTNGSSNSAYNYTASLSNTGIAEITSTNPVNIAKGEVGKFTVTGLKEGTVDITIKNDQSSSSYVRKGVIHLTVGEGGSTPDPEDPPAVDSVDVTPIYDTPYPERSAQINVNDTFTINVKNGTEHDATYTFTATLSENGIAELTKASTGEVAPGAVGTLTVKGIKAGTVDINIQNDNDMEGYTRKAIIHLTVVEAAPVMYTVKFVNDDGTSISETQYEKGTKAEAIEVPTATKEATPEFTYTFAGWDKEIADVTEDATYKATYTETKNKYTVTFVDENGTSVLKEAAEYDYGTKAKDIAQPETPTKEATAEYTYEFKAWDPAVADVTSNATYRATYEEKTRTYKVTWKNEDGTVLEEDLNVAYGTKVKYTGKTPEKAEDDKYTYTFEGWDPEIPEDGYVVTGETTFIPKFKAVEKPEVKPDVTPDGTTQEDTKKSDDSKVTPSPNKEAPSAEELAKAPLNSSLPVINPEKIKTTGSMSKQTMTIKLGKLNADNCLVEYRQAGAKAWKSQWYGKGASQLVISNMKKNGFYQYRFTTVKLVNGQWTKGKTSNTCYRWIKNIKAKKPVAGKKKFTFKWKKVKSANGYEIQYARNKAFTKSAKKVTVKGAKKTSKTIKGLKKGKTYYVRIRPYKTKGGKKYLGIYTVAKKVKVK